MDIITIIRSDYNCRYCNISALEKFVKDNNINLKELNNEHSDILISVLQIFEESNFKDDYYCYKVVKFILEHCQYKTLNYTFNYRRENRFHVGDVPLFSALSRNKIKVAKLLLNNGANINYNINNRRHHEMNIISYLCYMNYYHGYPFENNVLNFILHHGFDIKEINTQLMTFLITFNHYDKLETIFRHYIYDNTLILDFLFKYRNKIVMSNHDIKNYITEAKRKIEIKESIYGVASCNNKCEAINILFDYDANIPDNLINIVQKYRLLTRAIKYNCSNLVKKVLNHESFNVNNVNFEKHIKDVCRSLNKGETTELFIELLKEKNYNFETVNFESILLEASRRRNNEMMKLILKLLLNIENLNEITTLNTLKIKNFDQYYLVLILNVAIKINNFTLVKLLLENDELKPVMNINIADRNNETPTVASYSSTKYYSKYYSKDKTFNHIKIFKLLIEKGAEIVFNDKKEVSLLPIAIQDREYMILKYLLKRSINISKRDIGVYAHPLIKAICTNDLKIITDYIEKVFTDEDKKNIDYAVKNVFSITSCDGYPPLILSYLLNRTEITSILINRVMIDIKDYYGYSLLHYAILKEDISLVKDLIRYHADINNDKYTNFALDTAIKIQNKELFSLLINCDNIVVDQPNESGETPLLTLIKSQHFSLEDKKEMIEQLLKKEDCDINFIESSDFNRDNDDKGNTALIYAIKEGHPSIVKLLIDHGAEINEIYDNGNSPMKSAIQCESLPIIELLINNGANIHLKDSYDDTPLVYAIRLTKDKTEDIVRLLIHHHAKLNEEDVYNKTPLIYAIDTNSLPVIKLLVEHGANINHENIVFTKAIKTKNVDIINYFIKQHIFIPLNRVTEYYELISKLPVEIMKETFKCLVQNNPEFFIFDVLREIIRENQIDIIKILIKNDFDFNIKDDKEMTPLAYAILFNQKKIIRYIKESEKIQSIAIEKEESNEQNKKLNKQMSNRNKRLKLDNEII